MFLCFNRSELQEPFLSHGGLDIQVLLLLGDLLGEPPIGHLSSRLPQARAPPTNTFRLHPDISAQKTVSSAVIHTWPGALGGSQGGKESKFSTLRIFFFGVSQENQKAEAVPMDSANSGLWHKRLFCFVSPSHVKSA